MLSLNYQMNSMDESDFGICESFMHDPTLFDVEQARSVHNEVFSAKRKFDDMDLFRLPAAIDGEYDETTPVYHSSFWGGELSSLDHDLYPSKRARLDAESTKELITFSLAEMKKVDSPVADDVEASENIPEEEDVGFSAPVEVIVDKKDEAPPATPSVTNMMLSSSDHENIVEQPDTPLWEEGENDFMIDDDLALVDDEEDDEEPHAIEVTGEPANRLLRVPKKCQNTKNPRNPPVFTLTINVEDIVLPGTVTVTYENQPRKPFKFEVDGNFNGSNRVDVTLIHFEGTTGKATPIVFTLKDAKGDLFQAKSSNVVASTNPGTQRKKCYFNALCIAGVFKNRKTAPYQKVKDFVLDYAPTFSGWSVEINEEELMNLNHNGRVQIDEYNQFVENQILVSAN